MANNQIDPNQESNQLSDEDLEQVAGGGLLSTANEVAGDVRDFVGGVVGEVKDLHSDLRETFDKPC